MAAWAALEVLKRTTSYLLSPAYFASDLFWTALGYGPSSRHLITTVHRQQSLVGSTRRAAATKEPGRASVVLNEALAGHTVPVQEVEMVEVDLMGSAEGSTDESEAANPASAPSPTAELEPARGSEASTGVDSPFDAQSQTAETSIATSVPPLVSPTASSIETMPDRPLSTLLSLFSHRATVCLSSLELLPDDDSVFTDYSKEPTARQLSEVERRMASDVQVVEAAIEKAVERRGIDESVQVEAGRTYFEDMEMSFVNVAIMADGINTEEFLIALESLLKFFVLFAPAAANLASGDIIEDIRRIRALYLSAPIECRTLQLLVQHEQPQRRKLATQSLMWCFRGLKFMALSCRLNLDNSTEELSESFAKSWDAEYSSYFSWVVRPLFKLLVKACPPRAQFYEKLGSPKEKVENDLAAYLTAIESQVGMLEHFYQEGRHYK